MADPGNANIVYIGGDRITVSQFTAKIMRGNASLASGAQFTDVVNAGAGNTTPHADSRDNGSLLESSDGGIYRLTTPQTPTTWASVNGNLQISEVHDVAFDTLIDVVMTGTQDNGTHVQAIGSTIYTLGNGGDGGDVAVDNSTFSALTRTYRYYSSQNLGGFIRAEYNSSNTRVATASPSISIADPQFVTPIEINTVDPARMIVAGVSTLYESVGINGISPTFTSIGGPGANRNAVAYGVAGNPDLVYVGAGTQVWKRTTSGGGHERVVAHGHGRLQR